MSSNLKVNTVLPSVGTAIGIGTAGGSVSITSNTITALTGGSERLRINSDGKVGLGTTGSDYALSIREADNNNKWLMLQKNSGQEILQIREDGDNHAIIDGSHASGELHFYTAGVERLRLNTSGRLGLNTDSPDMTFTIKSEDLNKTKNLIKDNKKINFRKLVLEKGVSKLSIIGVGMVTTPGVTFRMFQTLANKRINIKVISTSEIKISVLIDKKNTKKALAALHKEFKLDK